MRHHWLAFHGPGMVLKLCARGLALGLFLPIFWTGLSACQTWMSDAEIRSYTTCYHPDLTLMRRSLLRHGVGIKQESEGRMETESFAVEPAAQELFAVIDKLDDRRFVFQIFKTPSAAGQKPEALTPAESNRGIFATWQRIICGS